MASTHISEVVATRAISQRVSNRVFFSFLFGIFSRNGATWFHKNRRSRNFDENSRLRIMIPGNVGLPIYQVIFVSCKILCHPFRGNENCVLSSPLSVKRTVNSANRSYLRHLLKRIQFTCNVSREKQRYLKKISCKKSSVQVSFVHLYTVCLKTSGLSN